MADSLVQAFFTGVFHVVTAHSLYEVKVTDLVTSPTIRKMGYKGTEKRVVPVTGRFLGGYYVGITANGVHKYRAFRGQKAPSPCGGLPKRFEDIKVARLRNMRTGPVVGLFFGRNEADECLAEGEVEVFDQRWLASTREVLLRIGYFHPLVTLSQQGEHALPNAVLPPHDHM